MANPRKAAQVPGEQASAPPPEVAAEEVAQPKKGVTELNNIAGTTANDVGADRENVVRAMAAADAARRGVAPDLAPAADIGAPALPTSIKRKAMINGVEVEVDIPQVRRNSVVEQFGPESPYPKGTRIRADGKPCEGNDEAVGIVSDINTPHGKLVNRVVNFDQLKEAI